LVERSRSGRGAHVWIFFKKPILAAKARLFGALLLEHGMISVNLPSFHFFDRMYPSQDTSRGIGSLVALPLQGQALKNGNSAFVDENWNAYSDQWSILFHTPRLDEEEISDFIMKMNVNPAKELYRPKPWNRKESFNREDVVGKLHITLANGIYVDILNAAPRLQNQIRSLAVLDNPIFYRNRNAGRSNYNQFSTIYLGEDVDGYIHIPRGQLDLLKEKCKVSCISTVICDKREKGRPIRVSFKGKLRPEQDSAAASMLSYDNGILDAATAFGKTVVSSYLIAQRGVSTLILLRSKSLLKQWEKSLIEFLDIDENAPIYTTASGRTKTRKSLIGTFQAGQNKMSGIIDIAMIGSICNQLDEQGKIPSYGLVIFDECHGAASVQAQKILAHIDAKYVYGVTATPERSDSLEKIIFMMIGPIRHQYTIKERAKATGIKQFVYPRFTRVSNPYGIELDINKAYELISNSSSRNDQIVSDISECIERKRSPVVLTRLKKHAEYLFDRLQGMADHVLLLYGDNTDRQNYEIQTELHNISDQESLILIATGSILGEGFDLPRLDTLMLVSPMKFEGRIVQYAGRIGRIYAGKQNVIIYDYVDSHIGYFDHQYKQRLKAYAAMEYQIMSPASVPGKQEANAIYSAENYIDIFERDLVEAESEVIIASPYLTIEKVERFIRIMKCRQEAGITVTVVTMDPMQHDMFDENVQQMLINKMKALGVIVLSTADEGDHYAVFDRKLVWHGGMNLLGKEDTWDNMIRTMDEKAAEELIQLSVSSENGIIEKNEALSEKVR
jgi:superfamily II DNA or RNA helicase